MQALYRLYRPQKFSELIGQEHVSETLLKALQTAKVSHAFLFIGPRGTGKTSTARILAKALNCQKTEEGKFAEPCGQCESCLAISSGSYLDLIEIDAASNRGIDEIRDLREKIKLSPTQGKFKVYIIDEVHMLTNEAFNALLKTLEEPPAHAVFVLCTTDPHKIPATIRSRTQVYEFKTPNVKEIVKVLEHTALEEKKTVRKEDLEKIAKKAKGAYRDALVLLEKHFLNGETEDDLNIEELALSYAHGDSKKSLELLSASLNKGVNPKLIAESLIDWNRKAMLLKIGLEKEYETEIGNELEGLKKYTLEVELGIIKKMLRDLTSSLEEFRYSSIPQLPLELAIVSNDQNSKKEVVESKQESNGEHGNQSEIVPSPEVSRDDKEEQEVIKVKAGNTEVTISTNKSGELETIQSQWIELLRKLRPINHSLEALLRSSEPVEYSDGNLTLKFFYRFHMERVEDPKNRMLVEKVFHDETGLPISLKLVLSDSPKPVSRRVASQQETPNVKMVDDKDIPEAALDIFTN
jgi:DNA polymerase-3 subunit gamma/tau